MTTQEGKGVEIVDANASVSASAATQPTDKKQITVSARAAGADVEPIAEEGDVEVNKLGKAGGDTGPYDEAPITRVDEHPDDVSSLHHDVDGKPDRYRGGEDAIAEGDEYYDEEEEQARALRRRNLLIIVMLLLFLGLVVAIGIGSRPADREGDGDDSGLDPSPTPSTAPSFDGPCFPVELGIIFDEYSDETEWLLAKGNYYPENPEQNVVVWESKYYNPMEYSGRADTFNRCFPEGYYTFVFKDKEGDGICCYHGEGSYVLTSEGKIIKIGGEMDAQEEYIGFQLPFEEPEPEDTTGDGLDDRLGWVMPYDSSNFTEGVDCENFRLVVLTDEYGIETTWELYEGSDKSGTLIANGGPYASEITHVVDYCLESPKRYALYMYDWARDGLCCESGEGMFKITSGDIVIHESDGQFGELNITKFTLPADGSVVLNDPTQSPTFGAQPKTAYPTAAPKPLTPPPLPPFGFISSPTPPVEDEEPVR
ncbi:hypothetical protein ACHAXT_008384 [Thalassiosira profunda]